MDKVKGSQILKMRISAAFFLIATFISNAQTRLPSFFSDGMVLQQQEEAAIWGQDQPGTTIKITASWGASASTDTDAKGQWKTHIITPSAGGPFTLSITGSEEIVLENIMAGEVWLCSGQSNMEMPLKGFKNQPINGSNEAILNSDNTNIRMFTVERNSSMKPLYDVSGSWKVASPSTTGSFSATAYFFAKKLEAILNVPIGLIHTSWGGSRIEAWMDKETISEFNSIELEGFKANTNVNRLPYQLYNAMVHPLIGYPIKGTIWYQGEGNTNWPEDYSPLFSRMIQSWRGKWQIGRFPFYYVQIAPYSYVNRKANSAYLREAQLQTMLSVENTGMAVTLDIADCGFIHPKEKKTVGDRLAYWALAKDYGVAGFAYSGPIYQQIKEIVDGKIRLVFSHADNGLSSFEDKHFKGFEIAGEDKIFYPAQARIEKQDLTVWSEKVRDPVAVRYAFDDCASGNLFNIEGLPASPFRTDDWNDDRQ